MRLDIDSMSGVFSAFVSLTGMVVSIIVVSYRAGALMQQIERKMDKMEASNQNLHLGLEHKLEILTGNVDSLESVVNQKLSYNEREEAKRIHDLVIRLNRIEAILDSQGNEK